MRCYLYIPVPGDGFGVVSQKNGEWAVPLTDYTITCGTAGSNSTITRQPSGAPLYWRWDITIPSGQTSVTATLKATDDAPMEGPENITFTIMPYNGDTNGTLGYITDDSVTAHLRITLLDGDGAPPTVTMKTTDQTAAEPGTDTGTFTISRTGPTAAPLLVKYHVNTSSNAVVGNPDAIAAQPLDYELHSGVDDSLLTGSITIPAGSSSVNIIVKPVNDSIVDPNEIVDISIEDPGDSTYRLGNPINDWVVILDDETTPDLAITTATPTIPEAGGRGVFTVTRTGNLGLPMTIPYSISGKALNGVDYARLWGSVTLPVGVATNTIALDSVDDLLKEGDEDVNLLLKSDTHWNVSFTNGISTIVIQDTTTDKPLVSVQTSPGVMREYLNEQGGFRFSRLNTAGDLTVRYTISGTAIQGTDYSAVAPSVFSGTVVIKNGKSSETVTLVALSDVLTEDMETVIVTITPDASYDIERNANTATIIIEDGDSGAGLPRTITVTSTDRSAAEAGPDSGIFILIRARSTTDDLPVVVGMTGTATWGTDYALRYEATDVLIPTGGAITIPAGADYVRIKLVPIDDGVGEGTEKAIMTIQHDAAYSVGVPCNDTVTIDDNDPIATTVAFEASSSDALESVTPARLWVVVAPPSASTVTVDYYIAGGTATGGVDYILDAGTLTFAPFETRKYIDVAIVNDLFKEFDETVIVGLRNPLNAALGANATHTYTIIDDDKFPTASFSPTSSSVPESAGTATLNVILDGAYTAPVTVNYTVTGGTATRGDDYVLADGSVTFAIGETLRPITVGIIDDTADEFDETVVVTITAGANCRVDGSNKDHVLTIEDNDTGPNVSFTAASLSQSETIPTAALTVTLTNGSGKTVTVDYRVTGTATGGGVDYTLADGTLTFAPGETSKTLTISVVNDNIGELNETVIVTLSNPTNASIGVYGVHTFTIIDDDATPLVITSGLTANPNPASLWENVQFTFAISGGISPINWSWNFGDGTTSNTGPSVTHAYGNLGTYHVTVQATDLSGATVSAALDFVVSVSGGGGGGGGEGGGSGGGGGSADGPVVVKSVNVLALSGKANFSKSGKDSFALTGSLDIGGGLTYAGAVLQMDVGGATASLTLDKKGRARGSQGTLQVKRTTLSGPVVFKARIKAGSWAALWADDGLDPAVTIKAKLISMPVSVTLNGSTGVASVPVSLKSTAGKGAMFKK
jgi:PKD repeat protein